MVCKTIYAGSSPAVTSTNRKLNMPVKTNAPKPCLGFRFTKKEEMLIDMHIVNSIRFMRKYGKGTQPFYRR